MYSYTTKRDDWIFNQNTINDFWPDCTVVSIAQIFWLNYDIWVEEKKLAELIEKAIEDWVLTDKGAKFSDIYNYSKNLVSNYLKEKIELKKVNIGSYDFISMINEWYCFWIWLKNWNKSYLRAVSDWLITKDTIDYIKDLWWWFSHNHIFWKKNWKYWIFEVYRWRFVKCNLDILEYWVKQWIWRLPARTFLFKDMFLEKALLDYKNEINIENVQELSEEEQKAISRASKLRVFKK